MKKLTFQNAYSKLGGFTLCALFSTFAYISCFSTILFPFPTIGLYLGSSISIMYATLLLILSKTYDGYKYPGYLQFVNGICLLVLILLLSVQNVSAIQWIAIIVGEMCRILSEYLEYRTHSKFIRSKSEELSKQWNKLFIVFLLGNSIVLLSSMAAAYSQLLGQYIFTAGDIIVVIAFTKKINYLKKTAGLLENENG